MSWIDRQAPCPVCAMNRRQFFRTGASLAAAGAAVRGSPRACRRGDKITMVPQSGFQRQYGSITHSVAGQKRLS